MAMIRHLSVLVAKNFIENLVREHRSKGCGNGTIFFELTPVNKTKDGSPVPWSRSYKLSAHVASSTEITEGEIRVNCNKGMFEYVKEYLAIYCQEYATNPPLRMQEPGPKIFHRWGELNLTGLHT